MGALRFREHPLHHARARPQRQCRRRLSRLQGAKDQPTHVPKNVAQHGVARGNRELSVLYTDGRQQRNKRNENKMRQSRPAVRCRQHPKSAERQELQNVSQNVATAAEIALLYVTNVLRHPRDRARGARDAVYA